MLQEYLLLLKLHFEWCYSYELTCCGVGEHLSLTENIFTYHITQLLKISNAFIKLLHETLINRKS